VLVLSDAWPSGSAILVGIVGMDADVPPAARLIAGMVLLGAEIDAVIARTGHEARGALHV
jgi:hypothetical protein